MSGIVVNDSLILIDFINRATRNGMAVNEAVIESGKARFRPVLLTSVTTIAGLFPLLLERSFQAQFLIPMAVSICFGLLAATVLTLLYVPALYLIVTDVQNIFVSKEERNLNAEVGMQKMGGDLPRAQPGRMRQAENPNEGTKIPAASRVQIIIDERQGNPLQEPKAKIGRRKIYAGQHKAEGKNRETVAVKKVAAAGIQMSADKNHKIAVREQRTKKVSTPRSRPATGIQQTTKERNEKPRLKTDTKK